MSQKYWEQEDHIALEKASSYIELFRLAEKILKRMPAPIGEVCGPISTGGAGSVDKNMEKFKAAIKELQEKGLNIFDQMPFEIPIHKILKTKNLGDKYDNSILEDFYLPIFESGMVKRLYFLPDWESSVGARWEHDQAKRLGLEVEYVTK